MNKRWLPVIAVGLALAVIVALLSPLASSHPDGLERVAEDKEFLDEAKDPPYEIIADYVFPGVENEDLATVLSGLVGVAIVAAIGFGLALGLRAMSRGRSSGAGRSSSTPGSG
jgi:hypothetical protein